MIPKKLIAAAYTFRLGYRYACRRLGLKGYRIHKIQLSDQGLIYIPIPKNACSSIKHALYEIEFDKPFDYSYHEDWGFRDIHDYYEKRADAFTGVSQLRQAGQTTFTIIRDPIKRLISCYRNRVVDLNDLEPTQDKLKQRGLSLKPNLNTFALRLEEYRAINKIIEHHSRPQHVFLGDSIDYLDRIFAIDSFGEVKQMLTKYRENLAFRKEKSGGTSFGLQDLSSEALEKLINFYKRDYELLREYYSPAEIHNEYQKLLNL